MTTELVSPPSSSASVSAPAALNAPLLQQPLPEAEWRSSSAALQALLQTEPRNTEAWLLLGMLGARARRYPTALVAFQRALLIAPAAAEPRLALIELLLLFGRLEDARAAIAAAPPAQGEDARMKRLHATLAQLAAGMQPGERLDLRDVTFLIPFRAESPDRLRNLRLVLRYLFRHLDTSVIVCEDDPGPAQFPALAAELGDLGKRCEYFRAPPHPSGFIHRTRDLNLLLEAARTPIVVIYDTDVVLPPLQYRLARDAITAGATMALPYNGLFIDLDRALVAATVESKLEVDGIDPLANGCTVLNAFSAGGAIFYDRQALLSAGGYNETFVSWGFEDVEIVSRLQALGLGITRTPGPLFHLTHARTGNSSEQHPFYEANRRELAAIQAMDAAQIRAGVAAGRFRRQATP